MSLVELVEHLCPEEGGALACGRVCAFAYLWFELCLVPVEVEDNVSSMLVQMVQIQSCGVL